MSSFAAWGMSVLGIAIVMTVAEMLLPHGKMRNVIRSVCAVISLLVIVTPIPSLLKNGVNFDFPADSVQIDTDYINFINEQNGELYARSAEAYLKEKGYEGITVSVVTDGLDIKSVTVNFSDSSITGNGAHINKNEITNLLAEYFGIQKEAVMAYG